MRLKYQGFLLQLFFFPLTTFALEEKECVIEFENNSSKNITNEDNLNYCLSALANKKIENIDPAFIGIMHNQKDWEIKE